MGKKKSISSSKCLNVGDKIKLKHYSMFKKIESTIVYFDEDNIRVQADEDFDIVNVLEGDHVILSINNSKDEYAIAGNITSVDSLPPFKVDMKISKIQSMKESRKYKRYMISELGKIKMVGEPEFTKVVVKNISFGGIKINSKEDVQLEEILDVRIDVDKSTKICFKGEIVRKERLVEFYEYGLEVIEIAESNLLQLHRFMNAFEFS